MSLWRRRKARTSPASDVPHEMAAVEPPPPPEPEPKPEAPPSRFISVDFDAADPAQLLYRDPHADTGVVKDFGAIPFRSESCSSHHFLLSCYPYWCETFDSIPGHHRKQWEFVYILQVLWERGMLAPGKRGLGFGVGLEPLPAIMAARGCEVVATDLGAEEQAATFWSEGGQHSVALSDLNKNGHCPPEDFERLVSFEAVDMNNIPDTLRGFDFCWSACALEHLGSLDAGLTFYRNSIDTLNPGGIAVHTTELNLSSDEDTLEDINTVLYRKKDLTAMMDELTAQGHYCEPLLIHHGSQPLDGFIDVPPYLQNPHLRLQVAQYVTTSVGIITRKKL